MAWAAGKTPLRSGGCVVAAAGTERGALNGGIVEDCRFAPVELASKPAVAAPCATCMPDPMPLGGQYEGAGEGEGGPCVNRLGLGWPSSTLGGGLRSSAITFPMSLTTPFEPVAATAAAPRDDVVVGLGRWRGGLYTPLRRVS